MNFLFDEQQTSLGETVAKALADFPALTGPDLTRDQDGDAWTALAELGLFCLLVPEEQGGVGLSLLDLAPAIEALGAGLAPPLVASTLVAGEMIRRFGSDCQRETLLGRIASGDLRIALAEAELGEHGCQLKNGVLSGAKIAVAGADEADLVLVSAADRDRSVLLLLDTKAEGLSIARHDDIDPSAGLCRLSFSDVAAGSDAALGAGLPGTVATETLIDLSATVLAGMAMGIAATMRDRSVAYALEREQFGKPIGAFQAIKHLCANLAVAVEAGQATGHYAFWTCAEGSDDRARAASGAKAYCSQIACQACNDAVQVHGGMGFTWEMGLHRYLRRAQVIEHAFGSRSWHYDRVARKTLEVRSAANQPRRDAA